MLFRSLVIENQQLDIGQAYTVGTDRPKGTLSGLSSDGFSNITLAKSYAILQKGANDINWYNSNRNIFANLPTYANEAAAVTAGLPTGTIYKTSTGEIRIKL